MMGGKFDQVSWGRGVLASTPHSIFFSNSPLALLTSLPEVLQVRQRVHPGSDKRETHQIIIDATNHGRLSDPHPSLNHI